MLRGLAGICVRPLSAVGEKAVWQVADSRASHPLDELRATRKLLDFGEQARKD